MEVRLDLGPARVRRRVRVVATLVLHSPAGAVVVHRGWGLWEVADLG